MRRKFNWWASAKLVTIMAVILLNSSSAFAVHDTCTEDFTDVYAGAAGALIGVDPDGTAAPGPYYDPEAAICVLGVPVHGSYNYYVDVDDTQPTRTGYTVQVFRCRPGDNACFLLLGQTGAEVDLFAPLFSCVWVNGTQQNPGC